MSYLKPVRWWLYPFRFMAKCQNRDIKQQYENYNVRLFDIRLKYYNGEWFFAHGFIRFKCKSIWRYFEYLNSQPEEIWVRMVLEYNSKPKDEENISDKYRALCAELDVEYKNLNFFGFYRKYDWKKIYDNGRKDPSIYQAISSMTTKKWDNLWPWLYAYFNNKDNKEQGTDKEYLLLDFVDYD